MKLTDESKRKLFDTYNQLIKSYGQEYVLQKIKRKMYNYMQRDKLDRATAFIIAVKVTAHETKADPSPITPASTRTTDGGEGSGNFGHAGRPGQVGGSGKGGGDLNKASVEVSLQTIDEGLAEAGIRKGDVVKVFGLRKDVLLSHLQNRLKDGKDWKGVLKPDQVEKARATKQTLIDNGMEGSKDFIKINRSLARYDFVNRLAEKLEGNSPAESVKKEEPKQAEEPKVAEKPKTEVSKSFKTRKASEVLDPSSYNIMNVRFGEFIKLTGGETRTVDGRKQTLRYQNNFCKVYMDSGMSDKNADITMHRVNDMLQDAITKIKSMYKESGKNPFLTICIGNIGRHQGSYNMQNNMLKINTFGQRQLKDSNQLRDTILHEMIHMTDNGEYRNNMQNNFNMVNLIPEWFATAHCLALTGESEFLGRGDPMGYSEMDTAYLVSAELSNYLIKNYGKEILMDIWRDKSEQSLLHRIMKLKDKYKIKENNWRELLYNACDTKDKKGLESRLLRFSFISNADIIKRGGQNDKG